MVRGLNKVEVVHFMKETGLPVSIRDAEIEKLQTFLSTHNPVSVENRRFHVHDKVRILYGALVSKEGEIKEVHKKIICVLLPSIRFWLIAELDKDCLQKIAG